MDGITLLIEEKIGISPALQNQIFKSLFIIIIMFVLFGVLKRVLYRVIGNNKTYYRVKKSISYIIGTFAVLLVGRIWFEGVQSVTTFLGLFSAGLAIAMKDLIMNVAGWLFILWKGPFRVGDRIEIGDVSGDVIDIQVLDFTLMEIQNWVEADQSTGRIVHIPNSEIFEGPIYNYSKGIPFIWNEIPINITFESDWEKAKEILQDISNRHGELINDVAEKSIEDASRKFMIFNAKLKPTVYTSMNENGVLLTLRYMCSYRKRRDSTEKIVEEILSSFKKYPEIEFAYPTQRVYDRPTENKRKKSS